MPDNKAFSYGAQIISFLCANIKLLFTRQQYHYQYNQIPEAEPGGAIKVWVCLVNYFKLRTPHGTR